LLQPIQLPSGKIVDLAKCIAIVPGTNQMDNQMIFAGVEQQIPIDGADLKILQQELKSARIDDLQKVALNYPDSAVENNDPEELTQKLNQRLLPSIEMLIYRNVGVARINNPHAEESPRTKTVPI
jgi:hypothetical protein